MFHKPLNAGAASFFPRLRKMRYLQCGASACALVNKPSSCCQSLVGTDSSQRNVFSTQEFWAVEKAENGFAGSQ